MAFHLYGTRIELLDGSPLEPDADALILPANDHLWMGSGPARIVKEAGGEDIEMQAIKEGPAGLGSAVVTGAGKLGFRHVVHAVAMGQDLHVKRENFQKAIGEALRRCDKLKAATVNLVLPLEPGDKPLPPETLAGVPEALFQVLDDVTEIKTLRLVSPDDKTKDLLHSAFLHQLH